MSCDNATAPINITNKNTVDQCTLKCSYQYHYGLSSANITNEGQYLNIKYESNNKTYPVNFNSEMYSAKEVRVYQPSIHQWNGEQAEGELVIVHTTCLPSSNQSECKPSLLVCIPLNEGVSAENASTVLDRIISQAMNLVPSRGETATINLSIPFTLNDFIPKKPFYSYTGISPVDNCSSMCHFVVFEKQDAIAVDVINLTKLHVTHDPIPVKNNQFFYNPNGPSGLKLSKGKDEIFIDCQPTDDSGQLLVTEPKIVKPVTGDDDGKPNPITKMFSDILKPFSEFLEGILLTILIVVIVTGLINLFTGSGSIKSIFFMLLKVCGLAFMIALLSRVGGEAGLEDASKELFK